MNEVINKVTVKISLEKVFLNILIYLTTLYVQIS